VQLRKYQEDCLDAIVENMQAGVRHQLVVMATGLGKTVVFSNLPARLNNGKMLVIAHRSELLDQAVDKIQHWNPTLKVGLEKAEHHAEADCDVIVACNASVGRAGSKRLEHFWDDIGTIVVDECHHILGGSYLNVLEDSGVLLPTSNKLLVGFTATPRRRNKARGKQINTLDDDDLLSLKSVFSKIVYSFPIRRGIKEGFLCPLKGFRVGTQTSLDAVKTVAGDFATDQLSEAVNTPERNLQVVKAWKENANNRPTLCFTVDVQHGKDLAEMFLRNGVMAQPIYGDDPQRADKLKWFESGQVQVLCNCALLTEGFDSPSVACIVLARPTKSGSLYTQMVGRGTRTLEGKSDCSVIDVVDNYKRCSLVTLPSLLGMSPELNLQGTSLVEAAETLEAAQEKYQGVDFTSLKDISKINAFVESVDLFAKPYGEEVLEFSKLAWMADSAGGYTLQIPEKKELKGTYYAHKHERLTIAENELGEQVLSISSTSVESKQLGIYNTLQEAFQSADEVMARCRPDRMKLVTREAEWHTYPASEPAKKLLRSLTKHKPMLYCICPNPERRTLPAMCPACRLATGITAGQASTAINLLKARRKH
jgi:superfamily II DNA or RNA helicase